MNITHPLVSSRERNYPPVVLQDNAAKVPHGLNITAIGYGFAGCFFSYLTILFHIPVAVAVVVELLTVVELNPWL